MNMYFVVYCLTIVSLSSIVDSRLSSPFDIRLDNYKVDTIRDLVINTGRPKLSWKIPFDEDSSLRNVYQSAYEIEFESIELTKKDKEHRWNSGMIMSSQSIHVPYQGHEDLFPLRYYQFRLRVWTTNSNESSQWTNWIRFRTSIFDLHEYLTKNDDLIWIGSTKINMNELRKEFNVPNTSPIKSANIYICGLGYYELYLNGQNVDPSRKLDPGWTTYEKRSLLVSFDVTSNITTGPNAVGVKLGNGWYSHEQHGESAYGPPRLLFTLTIVFENGDEMQVLSDQTWTGREGSVKHDSVYNGEIYDGRSERPGWSQVGFNDSLSAWITPDILPSPINNSTGGLLTFQDMPPVRAGNDALHFEVSKNQHPRSFLTQNDIRISQGASLTNGSVLKPISIWSSESGVRTFDIGQNMAGWCRIKFTGPSGFGTYIRYAETLAQPTIGVNHATGNIYTENLREATASDTYILRGDPNGEYYEPSFTYHGFRYVSVFGPPSSITADDVECSFVHSETTVIGKFSSSNPIINQIQQNIQWGQLSNSMSLPTDCPQRNERRGWMGDAALTVNEALYNFDFVKFYTNFLNLIVDVQLSDGQIPDYVPGNGYNPDPNWGTALPTIVWQLYKHTNDPDHLANYYNPVRSYVEYLHAGYNKTGLVNFFCKYGDWVPPPPFGQTNRALISSFAFLHDVDILLNMSIILEKSSDIPIYTQFYNQLTEEFHRVFFNSTTNSYADGLQAAQVLALALRGVVPSNLQNTIVENLVTNINQNGNHVTTGIVSNAQIYPVLSNNGHHDLAVQLVTSVTYPSYGYMFNNQYENATTIWELWNTPTSGPGMNSRNHHMYSSVGAWFYSHLAGLEFLSDRINIRPRMLTEQNKHLMKKLDCQLSTLNGLIHISYTRHEQDTDPNSILIRLTIPPNTKSTLQLEPLFPGAKCSKLIENKQIIWAEDSIQTNQNEFIISKDYQTGLMNIHLGSGQYEFQALWK